jgi:Na+/proline symporter
MIAGVAVVFFVGLNKVGGMEAFISKLDAISPGGGLTTAPPAAAPVGWVGYILVTAFGVWGMPQMISRYFTTKQKKNLKWGLLISVLWALIVALLAWWNGALGRVYFAENPSEVPAIYTTFDEIVPAFTSAVLDVVPAALFFAAVTAASLTTGEKVIMIASGSFSRDFYQVLSGASDKKSMQMTKIVNVIVVVAAVFMALEKPDAVLALCMFAWAALAATTLVPYVFGLFWKKGTAKAAILTGIIALFIALFWKMGMRGFCSPAKGCWNPEGMVFPFIDNKIREAYFMFGQTKVILKDVHEFVVSQVAAIILFPIISLLDQKSIDNTYVNHIFSVMKGKTKVGTKRESAAKEEVASE